MTDDAPPAPSTKRCTVCQQDKSRSEFGPKATCADGLRSTCRVCTNAYHRRWSARRRGQEDPTPQEPERVLEGRPDGPPAERWPGVEAFDRESPQPDGPPEPTDEDVAAPMAAFGSPMERECLSAMIAHGSVGAAAEALSLTPDQLRAHLSELQRRAARRGYAPGSEMTLVQPPGYHVWGVSTKTDGDGNVLEQWVKSKSDPQHKYAELMDAMSHIADRWQGLADPVAPPPHTMDDLMCAYTMGDPHLGMFAWAEETGNDFDLKIAERNLVAATDRLVDRAPPSKTALIVNAGDFFHADNSSNQTTRSHHALDVDTRWAKVMTAGIRTMRRCIDRALEKHELVHVINEIGNHDDHSSQMLALCLNQFYEREPRVKIDTSPAKFHWFRFGKVLIGVTHGDTIKAKDLPAVMANDRSQDWGETEHRHFYTGHVHHDSLKEYPGVTVETLRTLAPGDSWHRSKGYRAGRDMKCDVWHREHGLQERLILNITQIAA